jgi:glutamate racemase
VSSPARDAPIGVFDSGVGGLTVARALLDQLPGEPLLYVGDTAHGPYGPLPLAEVRRHALAAMDGLVAQGVKLLVIACNSASSACLRDARERYDVPVVEVIQPAVRRAVVASRSGRIGLLATAVTVQSRAYDDAFAAAPHVTLTSAACPRFVDFVERGVTTGRQVLQLATHYLDPLLRADVDTLVLGCTHYPLLTGMISLVVGDGVTLVSSAEETAKDVYRVLQQSDLGPRPGGAAAGAPLPRDRRPGAVRPPGPPVPRPRDRERQRDAGPRMRLTVLGCAGTFPGPGVPCSGYLVEHEGYRLLVDLGAGALGQLQRHIGLLDVDAVYVSHLHADHCIDLVAYSYARRYHPDGVPPVLPVYGSRPAPPAHPVQLRGAAEPRGSRTSTTSARCRRGPTSSGPLRVTRRGSTTRRVPRPAHRGRGPVARLLRRHRASPTRWWRSPGLRPVPVRGVLAEDPATTRRGIHLSGGRPASTPPAPAPSACCHPRRALVGRGRRAGGRRGTSGCPTELARCGAS